MILFGLSFFPRQLTDHEKSCTESHTEKINLLDLNFWPKISFILQVIKYLKFFFCAENYVMMTTMSHHRNMRSVSGDISRRETICLEVNRQGLNIEKKKEKTNLKISAVVL